MLSEKIQTIVKNLPDSKSAENFYSQLIEKFPLQEKKLAKNEGLLSDILTLAAFSPLLAATLLQHPDYIWWLNRQRSSAKVRGKEEILESLARFALTNSQIENNILLARFRRRELLRIYLRDIRNLGTIAEITEEISNLADAILEYALRQSRQELDNRYGIPLEIDRKKRAAQARFCIVALGKLGSNELNYASDIDLLYLYSGDGTTSGQGSRGAVTNREYFVKLAEFITKLVGGNGGEGAAYRVDLRLRPHGRVGALAVSLNEAVGYYQNSAQSWERQVLIRSRAGAGDVKLFHEFFEKIKSNVFSKDETIENALRNVRLSKEKINLEKTSGNGFNVKLGNGGIREIEFIAQALQIAYGGNDKWLRAPHTLISLTRLTDRKLLTETELTELFDAYAFLRRLEHRLQMENGLQTHLVPNETEKRLLAAKQMNFADLSEFDEMLDFHTANVSRVFSRLFGTLENSAKVDKIELTESEILRRDNQLSIFPPNNQSRKLILTRNSGDQNRTLQLISSLEKFDSQTNHIAENSSAIKLFSEISPDFTALLTANPVLIKDLPKPDEEFAEKDYRKIFLSKIEKKSSFANELAMLRRIWSKFLLEIVIFDATRRITPNEARTQQTKLAEASVEATLLIVKKELARKYDELHTADYQLHLGVLGLGKLGGGGMDYGSDLDLILVYDDEKPLPFNNLTHAEFYSRAVEIFVTALSSLTRNGHLYRVDLRLRPDGKNGAPILSKTGFLNYLENRSAMWEWLAQVKLRGVAGDMELARSTEREARKIIHENARRLQIADSKFQILIEETRRVREKLRESKARKSREIDIKYGEGGMLDVYFAVRFLQLRDNLPDDDENRSTLFTLKKLYENNSISAENYQNFSEGYAFLKELDHNLRLTIGRSTHLPIANQSVLNIIVERMKLKTVSNLLEKLTLHRLNIRASFENILKD